MKNHLKLFNKIYVAYLRLTDLSLNFFIYLIYLITYLESK